ncbi:MAG: hypothetical protein KC478_14180 [Bacteriovoracaceae bacterium]|nr:hypothetical protein [Bacteriovoracaceae bacterium]
MTTMVQLKKRTLNLSSKKLKELEELGYVALTFTGENLQPFHGFAKTSELQANTDKDIIVFNWQNEKIVAKFSKLMDEGWLSRKYVHHYSVIEGEFACIEEKCLSLCV